VKKWLSLILLTLGFSGIALGQNQPFSDITLSSSGRPVGGASIAVCTNPGLMTTAAAVTANVATLTMSSNPITAGFVANQAIAVSGFTGADTYFNGGSVTSTGITNNFLILAVTSTQIQYLLTHANATATSNGSVFQSGSSGQACAPLASITSDPAGLTPITQPGFTSTGLGNYQFYAPANAYYVQFYGNIIGIVLKPVGIPCAPNLACTITGSQTSSGNNSFTGANTFSGNLTATAGQNQINSSVLNGEQYVCSKSSSYANQTISAGLAALSSTQFRVTVCDGHAETLSANIVIPKSKVSIQFQGTATITMGTNQVTQASSVNGVSIIAPFAHSADNSGACQGACFSYGGTSAAFSIGDSSGFTQGNLLKGFSISLATGGAGNNAQGILLTNEVQSSVDDVQITTNASSSGQIGINNIGTGAFFTGLNRLQGIECAGGATSSICLKFGAQANSDTIVGGHAALNNGGSGGTCIDQNAGNTAFILNFDCDTALNALTVESTQNPGVWGFLRIDSGVTNFANFATNSIGNLLWTDDCTRPVTDNGITGSNSVQCGNRNQANGRLWQIEATSNNWLLNDLQDAGTPSVFAASVGSPTKVNAPSGQPIQVAPSSGSGLQICNGSTCGSTVTSSGAGGTMAAVIASGTSTLNSGALAATTCQATVTTAATGAAATDSIEWSFATVPAAADGLTIVSSAPTANNVNFVRCNPTAASQTTTAIVINWRVLR